MSCICSIIISISIFGQIAENPKPAGSIKTEASLQIESGLELLRQGDRSADNGEIRQAQIKYQAAMEKLLPGIRHKPFKQTVKRDETPREKLGQVLVEEWEKEVTPEEFKIDEATWKVMDLIPHDFDLKSAYVKLLTEEVAAFYDPKTKTMHLIREPEKTPDDKPKKPASLIEMIMGRDQGFDKAEAQGVMAHELTHALDDQHFDLDAMSQVVIEDDDATLALSALMEGEATLTMMAVGQSDWTGTQIISTPAEGLNRVMRWITPLMPMTGGATSRKSPPVMVESLIFPYLQGLVFCASLTNQGGWPALDRAYENPPVSTEQIIHPEKYQGPKRDWPMSIKLGDFKTPDGFKKLGESVIGELTTRILLSQNGGRNAAAGWDGDTLSVFESLTVKNKFACVWMTTWDSAQDAYEFASGISKQWKSEKSPVWTDQKPIDGNLKFVSGDLIVEMRGMDVIVTRGFKPHEASGVMNSIWANSKKTEKQFDWASARLKASKSRIKN